MSTSTTKAYRERLWPSPWLLILLLLLLPAVMLTVTPLSLALAPPIAIAVYVIIAGSLLLMSPKIEIANGKLLAGSATIQLTDLGRIRTLDNAALRRTIGPGADARAYLLVRGNIHRAIQIEIVDDKDPTPYWVITTRRPKELTEAIQSEKARTP